MTVLSFLNKLLARIGVGIAHETTDEKRHPLRLWTGAHVRGSWFLVKVPLRIDESTGRWRAWRAR